MSEEKEIVEEEEQKPMEQLRELRQQYPEINEVIISKNTISKILSNIYTSSNFSEKSEGVIFGRLTESQIIISSLFPTPISENPNNNLSNYLDTSRLDSTKLGFYLSNPGDEFLSHQKLKTFIEFQKIFPNCVILMIDTNAVKTNNYPFKCFRISEKLMEKFEEEEIEENIYLDKSNVVKEFYKQMFKKLNPNMNMIHLLNLKVGNDLMNLFEDLAEKKFLDEPENDMENNYFFNKGVNNNLNKKIKELNKGCEKLIEEQKKYIHFYKNKKLHNDIAFINNDNNKGIKNLGNTGEETFELFDLGLRSQNLKEINQSLKNILNRKEIDSYVACNLTK
jgi:hypothetical protein